MVSVVALVAVVALPLGYLLAVPSERQREELQIISVWLLALVVLGAAAVAAGWLEDQGHSGWWPVAALLGASAAYQWRRDRRSDRSTNPGPRTPENGPGADSM